MKKNKQNCDLNSCFLCRGCLPEWRPAIDAHRKGYHFKKGELIFREGDKVEGVYFVNSGKVKVHKKWGEEKELIIRFAKEGEIFGHRGSAMSDSILFLLRPWSRSMFVSSTWIFSRLP